jgi:starch-binding outer membrane protein SusE/F
MKNIVRSLIALTLVAGFTSCEDEQDLKFVSPDAEFHILTPQSGESVILAPETPNNPGLVMTWEDMDYGTPTEVTYTIEVDANGNEFAAPIVVATTTSNFISINMETLNGAALNAGLTPFSEAGLDVRVKSSVGSTGSEIAYSDVITYLVTPYTTEAPKMYVVGNFLTASGYGSDWSPGSAVPIAASAFGETDFEGYVYMNVPSIEFKVLPTNESFDGDWGDDGSFGGILVQEGESNIQMTGPGYFRIKADTALGVYSAQPTTWGVIGSATPTGWDSDTDMTFDPATKTWSVTMNLTGGQEMKFRANDDWGINFGDTGADMLLEQDGSNIAIATSGNYTITLDLNNPREYTYTIQAN